MKKDRIYNKFRKFYYNLIKYNIAILISIVTFNFLDGLHHMHYYLFGKSGYYAPFCHPKSAPHFPGKIYKVHLNGWPIVFPLGICTILLVVTMNLQQE